MIEMSEKEPGSLETQRSFKCQGSSSNILLHFRDSPGRWGLRQTFFRFSDECGGTISEVL